MPPFHHSVVPCFRILRDWPVWLVLMQYVQTATGLANFRCPFLSWIEKDNVSSARAGTSRLTGILRPKITKTTEEQYIMSNYVSCTEFPQQWAKHWKNTKHATNAKSMTRDAMNKRKKPGLNINHTWKNICQQKATTKQAQIRKIIKNTLFHTAEAKLMPCQ